MFCPVCGRSVESRTVETALPVLAMSRRDSLFGALAYLSPVPAIVFLALPTLRTSRFVRFQSWQSILFSGATVVAVFLMRLLFALLSLVPWLGSLFAWLSLGLAWLAIVVLWTVLVVKAGQGEAFEIPGLGPLAAWLTG